MPTDDRTNHTTTPAGTGSDRLLALEGVRGLGAAAVVGHHLAIAFWPPLYRGNSTAALVLAHTRSRVLHDGPFAVRVFFVLSGLVLSFAYFRRPCQEVLAEASARRYFRLTPPILASALIAFLLMATGAICPSAYMGLLDRAGIGGQGIMSHCCKFAPKFADAFRQGTWYVYQGECSYNIVLWSMAAEFIGSFVVFAFLALWGQSPRRWVAYLVVGYLLLSSSSLSFDFLLGTALCDCLMWAQRRGLTLRLGFVGGVVLLVAGVALGTAHPGWWNPATPKGGNHDSIGKPLGAALVLLAVLLSPFWRRQPERPSMQWLGRLSFSLYLIHCPILFAVGGWVLVGLYGGAGWSYALATSAAAVLVVGASLLAAWGLYYAVDRPAVRLSRAVARILVPAPVHGKAPTELSAPALRAA